MSVAQLPTIGMLGVLAALVGLVAATLTLATSPGRTASAGGQASRPIPPIDAEAPRETQTATFATG